MPKMKTHRGAAKRFKVTGSGKFMKNHSFKRHILGKKSAKRKRALSQPELVSNNDAKRISSMLPYSK
jgi:large subunit ribosomal protein L35